MGRCQTCGKEGYGNGYCSSCAATHSTVQNLNDSLTHAAATGEALNKKIFPIGYFHPQYRKYVTGVAGITFIFVGIAVYVIHASRYLKFPREDTDENGDDSSLLTKWPTGDVLTMLLCIILAVVCGMGVWWRNKRHIQCGCWCVLTAGIVGFTAVKAFKDYVNVLDDVVACIGCPFGADLTLPLNVSCPFYFGNTLYANQTAKCVSADITVPACFCTNQQTCTILSDLGDASPDCFGIISKLESTIKTENDILNVASIVAIVWWFLLLGISMCTPTYSKDDVFTQDSSQLTKPLL